MIAFVSARDLEAARQLRKEQKREIREEILREAKESYEKEKKREEMKRAREEDTWMLPAVKKRLGFKGEGPAPERKRKKKKREKEGHKKNKKHKRSKAKREGSESEGRGGEGEEQEEEEEDEWVEKGSDNHEMLSSMTTEDHISESAERGQASAPLCREEWMTMPLAPSDLSLSVLEGRQQKRRDEERAKGEKTKLQCFDKPGQHPRELNPFWRDGGSGLPSLSLTTTEPPPSSSSDHTSEHGRTKTTSVVGDGGHSWMLRAYKRTIEQSKEKGAPLEKIATEQWEREREWEGRRERGREEERGRERREEWRERERWRGKEVEGIRKGERERERRREEDREKRGEKERNRKRRNWKESYQKPDIPSEDPDSGFLKPGDLGRTSGPRAELDVSAKPLLLSSSSGYRPPSKVPSHSKKGKQEKYFHDDDRYSLKKLVEQERMMTAEETHAAIARMASKFVPASNTDETVDDALDSKVAMRFDEAKEEEKAKKRAVLENRKMAETIEKCQLCFDNPSFSKHLLIAVGMNTYLCAPWHVSLTEGQCYIVPMEHITCSMLLDENVWSEIEIFRKGLTRMFADHGMDVVFMETYSSVKRKTHMYIDCIPVPREEGALLPMYFKKAILESDEEWAQNRKLINTKEKGVRGSLPTGLPYFFAEFGLDGGYGHIIEDQDLFPQHFGREVVGGLLDLEPWLWLKPRRDDFEKQKVKVLQLSQWWEPYDWTQRLQQN